MKITEFYDRKVVATVVPDCPAIDGLNIRGFLLSDDKRACMVFESEE